MFLSSSELLRRFELRVCNWTTESLTEMGPALAS